MTALGSLAIAAGLAASGDLGAQATDTLRIGAFESPVVETDAAPEGWVPLSFGGDRGETRYRAARVGGRGCLLAEARQGGSGLLHPLEGPLESLSHIRWSWWVQGPVPGGDVSRQEGDDFAARVYVNFRFEPQRAGLVHRFKQRLAGRRFGGEAPGKALVYVWGNVAESGTMVPNAYTDQAMVVIVRSGQSEAGTWWTEERDWDRDFREAFGHPPPALHSIAVMTDADDTGTEATACYGDILLF